MPYAVELSLAAARQFKKLPENVRGAVASRLSDRLVLVLALRVGSRAEVYERIRKEDLSFLRKQLEDRR